MEMNPNVLLVPNDGALNYFQFYSTLIFIKQSHYEQTSTYVIIQKSDHFFEKNFKK